MLINPRSLMVLIRDRGASQVRDRTLDVSEVQSIGQWVKVVFINGNKPFEYGRDRVMILGDPKRHALREGERIEVEGTAWDSATEVLTFTGAGGAWSRIFYRTQVGEACTTYPASQVRVITSATQTPAVAGVLDYWRAVVSALPVGDSLRIGYERLAFVHPDSALNSFLSGLPIESPAQGIAPIFPFRCNLSQRAAVEKALTCSISVIEGPPGTGKTETILNLIANIVAVRKMTVGIVSFGNAAVDNVRDKLDELGFGYVVIFTTVLDETWRGRTGLVFVDDPQLINVAVSRAIQRFILVTNNDMLLTSRHIRDLVGYIRYHNPGEDVVDSTVVSVFDLLYRAYSQRLRPLAARLRKELKYPSEDIIWTVLQDIIAEERYAHLTVISQVLLRNLLPDLSGLTPAQRAYVQHRASVDFVVYNRVTNQPLLAIEVDGFAFHENNPDQRARDALKDEILATHEIPLLRLPTTGSGEHQRIREALDDAEARHSV